MTPLGAVAAIAVIAAGAVATSARDPRFVALAMLAALAASPIVPGQLPSPLPYAAEAVGAVLAAYLVWLAARRVSGAASDDFAARDPGPASEQHAASERRVAIEDRAANAGIPAYLMFAFAVSVAGAAAPVVVGRSSEIGAQGAGVALIALAIVPLLGREPLRAAGGLLLGVDGALLLRAAWLGPASGLVALIGVGLLVAIAAVNVAIAPLAEDAESSAAMASRRSKPGSKPALDAIPSRRRDDARRRSPREPAAAPQPSSGGPEPEPAAAPQLGSAAAPQPDPAAAPQLGPAAAPQPNPAAAPQPDPAAAPQPDPPATPLLGPAETLPQPEPAS